MTKLLFAVLLVASCGRENQTCSTLTPCLAGGYQFCKAGLVCSYQLSDGTTIKCASCSDCVAAVALVEQWCDPSTNPFDLAQSGPDLAQPPEQQADLLSPTVTIPKSGSYTGQKIDPGLESAMSCPDVYLEPNERYTPLEFSPQPDQPTPRIIKLSICPKGTGDIDWFKVDLTATLHITAQIFYDVARGDLDVAILDANGRLLSYDGSAVSDGCAATVAGPGSVFVVVTGANNIDVNIYEILIKTYAAPHACP